ncbi:MAG: PKD domain-containing protein, partial [Bacteroidia bacterium]
MRKRLLLATLFIPFFASAQTFWTENFNNGCSAGCDASAYVGGNGAWTQTVLGAEGADPNLWYVSCAENGHTNNICGTGCVAASATATLASLHVGANPSFIGDIGAAYDAGGLCGILTCPQTNRRIESPTINCTGYSTITLSFNYIEAGTPPNDDASVWYYDGATWSLLVNTPATNNAGCGGQGRWTTYTFVLPASANNNPNVKIGFLWVNNDDGVGTDPSFAVDDMTLSVVNNNPPTAAITASATSICAGSSITFSDNSTGGPTSWAWTFPSGSPANSAVQNPGAVTWNNAGTYTVTLTATNGNGNTSTTQVITVNPSPTVTATANPQVICTGNNTTLTALGAPNYVWQPGNLNGSPQVVSPAATTTYTVTGTDANGCQDTGMVTVTVQICAAPVAAFTASATSVCVGVPVNFTDNTTGGPTTWAWTFPSGTPNSSAVQNPSGIVWNSAGTYTVSLTASNINGTSTATLVITVNPAPTVTAITNNAAVCAGSLVTLTGNGASNYLWQPGNLNGNPQNITPAATTTYTVIGTDA